MDDLPLRMAAEMYIQAAALPDSSIPNLRRARMCLVEAARRQPLRAINWSRLAEVLAQFSTSEPALALQSRRAARQAIALAPHDPAVGIEVMAAAVTRGDHDIAQAWRAQLLQEFPALPAVVAAAQHVQEAVPESLSNQRFKLKFVDGPIRAR
jgi:hypothetical protein